MASCEKCASYQVSIVHSETDTARVERVGRLKLLLDARSINVRELNGASDLPHLDCARRCIVYLSDRPLDEQLKIAVLNAAEERGLESIVVVKDPTLDFLSPDWTPMLCFCYKDDKVRELCRELSLIITTPVLQRCPARINGYAAAFRFFNGYLRIVLPEFRQRLKELYTDTYNQCVKKLLIVCPQSCQCPPEMKVPELIQHSDQYAVRNVTRAGQKHRDYHVSVYWLKDKERGEKYYFAGVFANSLMSLCDIQQSGLSGISQTQMYRVRNQFLLHLPQLLESYDAAALRGQYRLLYWRDRASGSSNSASLYDFLLPVVREELAGTEEELSVSVPASTSHKPAHCIDIPGVNPAALYSSNCYPVTRIPKGICLLINIANFDGSAAGRDNTLLLRRDGAEIDEGKLKKLFGGWLKFDVRVHKDMNESELWKVLTDVQKSDHSRYDALVCCIMSHGFLGHIYTRDGKEVKILDVAELFYPEKCATLTGKPKLFFIQSCQNTSTTESSSENGSVLTKTDVEPVFTSDAAKCRQRVLQVSKETSRLVPEAADFFMSYSTLPGDVSYRDPEKGSLYVQALAKKLQKGNEIGVTLKKVTNFVKKKIGKANEAEMKQFPFHFISVVHKELYLCGSCGTTTEVAANEKQAAAMQETPE